MNQQDQGSGPPSIVPMKRKRGRPRKEGSVIQGENVPVIPGSDNVMNSTIIPGSDNVMNSTVIPGSDNVMNSNLTASTTDDCDNEMVGKAVTGVIEGTFNAGFLLNVKVADSDEILRGLVFLPGQVAPVTVENDVAPHVRMIQRKEIPIPVLNPQAEVHGSVPSSVQCSKQSFEPELPVPVSVDLVLQTESHSGISGLLENPSASTSVPISISSGGIPQGTSEPGLVNQSAPIMLSDHDKNVKQGETLHELDASTRVKESSADGGETKDSEAASEIINPVSSIENTNKELRTGQQAMPYVHQLNEVTRDEPNISNIEFNLIPLSAVPEAMPSEQTSQTVNYFAEKQELPKTDVLEDAKAKLTIETSSNVDSSNPNGRPSTGVTNTPVEGPNHALEASHLESLPSEQIGKTVPSVSKFSFEGQDSWGKSEALPSEQTSKTANYFVEKQELPKIDVLEDTKTKLPMETLSDVDTSNSNRRPSTDVDNVESNRALETSQHESMPSEQIGKSVPFESKFSFEGHDLQGKSDPQNLSSFGDMNKVDFNQPTESSANSMQSEKDLGSGT